MFNKNNRNWKLVKMMQWAITNSTADYPILKTWNIIRNAAVTFYNEETTEAILVSFATTTKKPFSQAKKVINFIIKTLTKKIVILN